MSPFPDQIAHTLELLRAQIQQAVTHEQRQDQLTGLQNDLALMERLGELVGTGQDFWAAFVEIDKFKTINDVFGYENADILLRSVADEIARDIGMSPLGFKAYRAHGDEFYLVGEAAAEVTPNLQSGLYDLCTRVRNVRVEVAGAQPMQCTVSVGWLHSVLARSTSPSGGLTPRYIKVLLERAVSVAKRKGRDRVEQFSQEMNKLAVVTSRGGCHQCQSSFSVDVPADDGRSDDLYCPNCGQRATRPPRPGEVPSPSKV